MPVKNKPTPKEETHKGYNEKNPTQPHGAFTADNVEQPISNTPPPVAAKKTGKASSKKA